MPVRIRAGALLRAQRIATWIIGLAAMLLLPQSASATVIFVVLEHGYGPLAQVLVANDDLPIYRLYRGRLFDVGFATDGESARRILEHRPGWARWNVLDEVRMSPQELERDFYVLGSHVESITTLRNDVTQVDLARRQRERNQRQLLDAWALLTVMNIQTMLYVDTDELHEDAFNRLGSLLRGMNAFEHAEPVLRIRHRVFQAALTPSLAVPGHSWGETRPLGIPDEILYFIASLYQRDQLRVATFAPSRTPMAPLPVRSPAGRIVALITGYVTGEPFAQDLALHTPSFIFIYQALVEPLAPLWRDQWTQPVLWRQDPSVAPRFQRRQARAWQLDLLPGSLQ